MGGKTGMLVALGHPELVEKLVVVDVAPTPAPGREETEDLVQAMKSLDLSVLKNRREADAMLQSRISVSKACRTCILFELMMSIVQSSSVRDFLLSNLLQSPDNKGMMWRFNLDVIADNMHILKDFPDIRDASFNGHTLFLGGGRSNYIK